MRHIKRAQRISERANGERVDILGKCQGVEKGKGKGKGRKIKQRERGERLTGKTRGRTGKGGARTGKAQKAKGAQSFPPSNVIFLALIICG